MPTQDPFESMEPEDFGPVRRRWWVVPAALLCLFATLLLVILSI